MRIHTEDPVRVEQAIRNAVASLPGVTIDRLTMHRSRKRAAAVELRLHGTSTRQTQDRTGNAATWDEWGVVFDAVFTADNGAQSGEYLGLDHYRWSTGNRFRFGMPEDTHQQHRWEYTGSAVTGAYHVYHCTKCDALMRRVARGYKWADLA